MSPEVALRPFKAWTANPNFLFQMLRSLLGSTVNRIFAAPSTGRVLGSVLGTTGAVFFLHRFDCYPGQQGGHRVEDLRGILEAVRRARIDVVSVDDAVAFAVGSATPPRRRPFVAFSIDDCYWDFVEIALPIFRQFDAPVTGFMCPGLLEQDDWFWWDKLEYVLDNIARDSVFEIAGRRFPIVPLSLSGGHSSSSRLCEGLKEISHDERLNGILRLADELEVALPKSPPERYRPAPLTALQAVESPLVQFGAHTMTHPILTTCTDAVSHWEITESVNRVRGSFSRPSTVFCYPNGTLRDVGPREFRSLETCEMQGAMTTINGRLRVKSHIDRRYAIPRFALGSDPALAVRRATVGR